MAFNVRQKQVAGMTGSNKVSYIDYVELNLQESQIRLFKGFLFTINGFGYTTPYSGQNGVKVNRVGASLIVSTDFGLSINWDGVSRATYSLSTAYAGFVCGLCGNEDGKYNRERLLAIDKKV